MTEGNEQKKKRMKGDSDIPRLSPSMRNQQEFFASLKGEQVWIDYMEVNHSFSMSRNIVQLKLINSLPLGGC